MPVDSQNATIKGGEGFELVPEGVYTVEVLDVQFMDKDEDKNTQFTPKDKFKFVLAILDSEHRGRLLWHRVTTTFTSGFKGRASKLYELVCAVMGEKVDDGIELDINTLISGQLRVVVKHNNGWANVTEVMKVDTKLEELSEETRSDLIKSVTKERVDVDEVIEEMSLDLDGALPSIE
jgi:hypothetical protein